MMKEINFENSAISAELTYNLMEHHNMSFPADRVSGLYRVIFFTIADVLKNKKNKSNPRIGFVLKDNNGEFKFGAILIYHAPEDSNNDDDDRGNYTLEFTLDAKDMEDLDVVYDNHSDAFITSSTITAYNIMTARFMNGQYCNDIFCEAIDTFVKFMDANASETEEVVFVNKGVFTATITVENGEKNINIVPGDMVKQYIKGDSSL